MGVVALMAASLLLTACGSVNTPAVDESDPATAPTDENEITEVEPLPFNASGLLGGTAQPHFADGDAGVVSVVQIGPLQKDRGTLLFAFRNNTDAGISHVDWTATARSGGSIVATGSSQGTTPSQVQPGEVGLAYIFFDNSESIPDDAEYEFAVETSPVDTSWYNTAPFKVTEVNLVGESIVGAAINTTGALAEGPYSVSIYCFDGDDLFANWIGYAEQIGEVVDGGVVTFSQSLYGDDCPTYAVGVSGYFSG